MKLAPLIAALVALLLSACGTIVTTANTVGEQGGRAITTNNDNRYAVRQACFSSKIVLAASFDAKSLEASVNGKTEDAVYYANLANATRNSAYSDLVTIRTAQAGYDAAKTGDGSPSDFDPFPASQCEAIKLPARETMDLPPPAPSEVSEEPLE